MASVKVAVRVRPFNQREKDMNAKLIVQMEGKKTRLLPVKNSKEQNDPTRDKSKDFTFDHSYWSYDGGDNHYASQEQVFSELGVDVIESAFEGYNACVFAYGQTGSGKTFTMMGSPDNQGLIPRICRQLFSRVAAGKESGASYRTEVSYLEIYNERVKDLLATDSGHSLRVREHPRLGPYVQDLSRHLVSDYIDIQECMHRGNLQRTTASTQMNDVSSRSHAIFTITFVQASYLPHNNMPSETVSKVHLVDLAGSERADATGATGQRLVEGAHINKSLVTLGSVISALAEASQLAAEARTPKGSRKAVFIPYRDSVLTWLLKDSLGGNSKTIMIAAISPADCNYGETLSTLRYANRAKNIINKPTINEDPNVKLIRELREEIEKLRAQISHTTDPIDTEPSVLATLQRKEAQEKVLTEKWTEKWRETQQILQEQKALGLRKSGLGVVLDSDMPHLVGIDDNLLSTGVTLYHLKEGDTVIGNAELSPNPDITVSGAGVLPLHCKVRLAGGVATLLPAPGAQCWLNTVPVDQPAKLSQGCILLLGRTNMFRYNDPAEAAKLRQEGAASVMNLSRLSLLSWSATDLDHDDEVETDVSAQRAELAREREEFLQQQEVRQRELLRQQKRLEEEREAMEREMERGWGRRRRTRRDGSGRTPRRRDHKEDQKLDELRDQIESYKAKFEEFNGEVLAALAKTGVEQSTSPESGESDSATERLERLIHLCSEETRERFLQHKKELADLEEDLRQRSERNKLNKLQLELASLSNRSPCNGDSEESSQSEDLPRSKSEMALNGPPAPPHATLSDEPGAYRPKKTSLGLPLETPMSPDESFHTATSETKPLPGDTSLASPTSPTELNFQLGPVPDADDSDGSSDDYHKPRIVDGQSSSSIDRSPEERHQRAKQRRRVAADRSGRRQVTEAEALRAMQRLCQRIAAQKMLVISSLENDCSKEELNRQIAVLQDLQKKYVRLEMALQYSFFDKQASRRNMMVTPIQETPSLTLSESDMAVASEPRKDLNCNQAIDDPLLSRLKDSEIEASDNVSTSNDELQSEGAWSDHGDERPRNNQTIPHGLMHPIDFDRVISIPGWVTRGSGAATHHEYEVRVDLGEERWVLLRRYRRFRELCLAMRRQYGGQVSNIPFPPRVPWPWARPAAARRGALEHFLRRLLQACAADPRCPFHGRPLTRESLLQLAPFFRKGVFESGKCGTG